MTAVEPWKTSLLVPTIGGVRGVVHPAMAQDGRTMSDIPQIFSQFDISAGTVAASNAQPVSGDLAETNRLLRDLVVAA